MRTSRAISIASRFVQGFVCSMRDGEAEEYHKTCLAALREKREREENRPLTREQLLHMAGEPVWVVWKYEYIKPRWYIVGGTIWVEMFFDWDGSLKKDYGTTWTAYRHKTEDS